MSKTISTLWQVMGEALALYYRDAPLYDVRLTPNAWLVTTGEPAPELNLGFVGGGPDAGALLASIAQVVKTKGIPAYLMLGDPAPEELAPAAAALGLKPAGTMPLMTYLHDGGDPRPSRCRIEPITTEVALADSHRIASVGLNISLEALSRAVGPRVLDAPGATLFMAYDGDRPISTVTTMRAGPLLGIFSMATLPDAQRKGFGRALIDRVIAHHRRQGARLFYLLATPGGEPLYQQIGFRTAMTATVYST